MGFFDNLFKKNPSAQNQAPAQALKKKILIAEADPALGGQYVEIFKHEFDVLLVGNGADGLNSLLNFPANLIVIDLDLPVMNGKTMLHSLRTLPPFSKTPVIVISATADAETIRLTKVYDNANAFILKENASAQEIYNTAKTLTL